MDKYLAGLHDDVIHEYCDNVEQGKLEFVRIGMFTAVHDAVHLKLTLNDVVKHGAQYFDHDMSEEDFVNNVLPHLYGELIKACTR